MILNFKNFLFTCLVQPLFLIFISFYLGACSLKKIQTDLDHQDCRSSYLRLPASISCHKLLEIETAESSILFQNKEPIRFELSAGFDRVHKANEGGNWTGEDRDDLPQYWSNGTLKLENEQRTFRIRARARGMSSAQDSQFPKLRIEIDKSENIKGTLFQGNRKFRLNTHVQDKDAPNGNTEMGRLADERSPYREALAYELGAVWNIPAPLVQRARISYHDSETGDKTTRNALLIETNKNLSERLGVKESFEFLSEGYEDKMSVDLAAKFHLFQIMILNDDIGLKMKNEMKVGTEKYRPYFNTTVFEYPNGEMFPILYDFDLSILVAGWEQRYWHFYESEVFEIKDGRFGVYLNRLAHLRSRLSKAEFDRVIIFYKSIRNQFQSVIQASIVDNEAKQIALQQIQFLNQAIEEIAKYPMLIKSEVMFYADSGMTRVLTKVDPVTEMPGALRPGTPVKILERGRGWIKIAILDMKNDILDVNSKIGYIREEDLQLGFELPENLQGFIDGRDLAW